MQGYLGVCGDDPHTVKTMSFSDPLEEVISTCKIPYQVVVLGADELRDIQDGNAPKVASIELTEESSEVPLQTRTISLEEVKANIERWRPSNGTEYESLLRLSGAMPNSCGRADARKVCSHN